jgi:hypothetical protein
MSISIGAHAPPVATTTRRWHGTLARGAIVLLAAAACAAGFEATAHVSAMSAVTRDGAELTRLLRSMALLKMLLAAAATAGIAWRFGSPARLSWMAGYGAAIGAMWIGPGLIWDMAHLKLGALMLHGGLAAGLVMLWRDPVVGDRLAEMIAQRRRVLATRDR